MDVEFPELTQQADKVGVSWIVTTEAIFSDRLFNKILMALNLNKDDFTHLKAYNVQWNSKSYNRLLL